MIADISLLRYYAQQQQVCMGLCSSAASTPDTIADCPAFCARLKLNYLNMPILIIKASETRRHGPGVINVDGPLPQDVVNNCGFEKIDNGCQRSNATKIPSMAALLSTLIDQHGWKLEQTTGPGPGSSFSLVFVLSKPPE